MRHFLKLTGDYLVNVDQIAVVFERGDGGVEILLAGEAPLLFDGSLADVERALKGLSDETGDYTLPAVEIQPVVPE